MTYRAFLLGRLTESNRRLSYKLSDLRPPDELHPFPDIVWLTVHHPTTSPLATRGLELTEVVWLATAVTPLIIGALASKFLELTDSFAYRIKFLPCVACFAP